MKWILRSQLGLLTWYLWFKGFGFKFKRFSALFYKYIWHSLKVSDQRSNNEVFDLKCYYVDLNCSKISSSDDLNLNKKQDIWLWTTIGSIFKTKFWAKFFFSERCQKLFFSSIDQLNVFSLDRSSQFPGLCQPWCRSRAKASQKPFRKMFCSPRLEGKDSSEN